MWVPQTEFYTKDELRKRFERKIVMVQYGYGKQMRAVQIIRTSTGTLVTDFVEMISLSTVLRQNY